MITKQLFFVAVFIFTVLSCTKETDGNNEKDNTFGTVEDIDGNVYNTVVIGDQTWMAENIRVTTYSNGDKIPLVSDDDEWVALENNDTDKAYCFYDNDESEYAEDYGALYTYAAVVNGESYDGDDVQGLCPDGWHIPSASEWKELISYVGGSDVAAGLLKESGTSHWEMTDSDISDEYSFSALPGGYRYLYDASYNSLGWIGYWWSSSENTAYDATIFYMNNSSYVSNRYEAKSNGASVRCVED